MYSFTIIPTAARDLLYKYYNYTILYGIYVKRRGQDAMVTLVFKPDRQGGRVLELGLYSFTIIHPACCNQGN